MEVSREHLTLPKKFLVECEELLKVENSGLYLLINDDDNIGLLQLNVRGWWWQMSLKPHLQGQARESKLGWSPRCSKTLNLDHSRWGEMSRKHELTSLDGKENMNHDQSWWRRNMNF